MSPTPDGLELPAANVLSNCYLLNFFDANFLTPYFSPSRHTSVWVSIPGSDLVDKSAVS